MREVTDVINVVCSEERAVRTVMHRDCAKCDRGDRTEREMCGNENA